MENTVKTLPEMNCQWGRKATPNILGSHLIFALPLLPVSIWHPCLTIGPARVPYRYLERLMQISGDTARMLGWAFPLTRASSLKNGKRRQVKIQYQRGTALLP
jgi:hypothetical protein